MISDSRGRSRGEAYVILSTANSVERAMALSGTSVGGRRLDVVAATKAEVYMATMVRPVRGLRKGAYSLAPSPPLSCMPPGAGGGH